MLFRWIQPYGFYQPPVTCVISRSWVEKEGFSESHKTLLKIQQGDSQVFPYTGLDRLPNATQAKPATASLLLNRQQLDRLPSTHRRWDSDSSARWWLLENCLPANTDDETPTHYWIHETLSKLEPLTPWHWVGYTCLDEQRRPLEHLLSQLYHHRETPLTQLQHLLQSNSWLGATLSNAQRMLPVGLGVNTLRKLFEHSHQLKHYLPRLNSVEPGDLQQHLLGLLDKNKDRWLSPEKIGQAQQKPWLQQRLASLATKTHSEWHWNANKWKALDGLANHTCNSPNPQWAAQKELIEQLCWWKDVAAETELKADGLIWCLHPVLIPELFFDDFLISYSVDVGDYKKEYVISFESYNELILYYEGYVEVPYVPRGSNISGVTLGYGYDLGHQLDNDVIKDLSGIYSEQDIERLRALVGLKGDLARQKTDSVSDIRISKDNALLLSHRTKSRYAQWVVDIYPQSIALSPNQKGVLLSLVYNRGKRLSDSGSANNRSEMRGIKEALVDWNLNRIPSLIRNMKRLWDSEELPGLIRRRESEALLFEGDL